MKKANVIAILGLLNLLTVPVLTGASNDPANRQAQDTDKNAMREITIVVDGGYSPSRIVVNAGERIRLRFTRRDLNACASEVLFPTLNIRRELPLNQSVVIDLPALGAGEYAFRCAMNMNRGIVVVQS